MLDKVVIANRGEIALRICERVKKWGLRQLQCIQLLIEI